MAIIVSNRNAKSRGKYVALERMLDIIGDFIVSVYFTFKNHAYM